MKIVRNILGTNIEIELTGDEVYRTYLEQEGSYDIQDVQTRIDGYRGRENEFVEQYGVDLDSVDNNADLIYSIATAKRHNMDKHNMDWEYALDEAFNDCLIGLDG